MMQEQKPKSSENNKQKNHGNNFDKRLYHLVRYSNESQFASLGKGLSDDKNKVFRLRHIQRALGMIEATVNNFEIITGKGDIDVSGHGFHFIINKKAYGYAKIPDAIGKKCNFTFWPTWETPLSTELKKEILSLPVIKISNLRKEIPLSNYVEVIGKLSDVFTGGFEVSIFSKTGKVFYIYFSGEYPYPEKKGDFIWVKGEFKPSDGIIAYKETGLIEFLPTLEAEKIISEHKKQKHKNPRTSQELINSE